MKAKEEYVDAPRETRSKDITVYAIIFLILLVGAGIFLAVRLLHKPADAALASSKSGIIYDSSAVEGGWDNLSPEEIAEKLNEKVAEGMINISMNTAPYFENGKAEGNIMIVNEDINLYPQQVEFISCGVCKCHSPCSGYLMSADAGGKPVLISIAEYERLTAQRIDSSECRGQLSRSAFEDIYALYLNWCLSDDESCCLQILSLLPSE